MSLLLAAALAVAAAPAPSAGRFAIVIGENEPGDAARPSLEYADDDAVMTARLLRDAGVETTLLVSPDEDTRRLFDLDAATPPTRAALEGALSTVFARIRAARAAGLETELLLFYSGHGEIRRGEGSVALRDGRLTRSYLYEEILAASPAHLNHVIIDACRSYFMVFGRGPGGRRTAYLPSFGDVRERFGNTGFILSTSSDRESHEWGRIRGGVFSHEVRSALRGAADTDLDGRISYRELGAFVESANAEIRNERFRPNAIVVAPRARDEHSSYVLAWAEGTGTVELGADANPGHIYVEDRFGNRLVDAHPEGGQSLRLALSSDRPQFIRSSDGRREHAITSTGAVSVDRLAMASAPILAKGSANLAFEALFAEPFGATQVAAYDLTAKNALLFQRPPPTAADRARSVVPWVTAGTAAAGIGMHVAAYAIRTRPIPQTQIPNANRRIGHLNTGAMVGYSLALASALTWVLLELGVFDDAEATW